MKNDARTTIELEIEDATRKLTALRKLGGQFSDRDVVALLGYIQAKAYQLDQLDNGTNLSGRF